MYKTYKDIFDQRAHLYHLAMQQFPHARDHEFALAVQYLSLQGNERILDMPAGGGYLRHYLRHLPTELIAMETCATFASHSPDFPDSKLLIGSFEHIPLASQSLDRVICLAALHHVENKALFFAECQRLIQPQGYLVIADVQHDTETANFLNIFVNKYNSMGHEGDFIKPQLDEQLQAAGFTIQLNQFHEFRWYFPDKQAMLQFCRNLFGIDQANDQLLFTGIEQYLAPEISSKQCSLRWQLRYINASTTTAVL